MVAGGFAIGGSTTSTANWDEGTADSTWSYRGQELSFVVMDEYDAYEKGRIQNLRDFVQIHGESAQQWKDRAFEHSEQAKLQLKLYG